jgi:hypothetical protein
MTDLNRKTFEDARDHLNTVSSDISNTLDKAVLSLSSAGFLLTIALTKFLIPVAKADMLWMLKLSWGCFGAAIVFSILSLLSSKSAITEERNNIYQYYMLGNDEFGNKSNFWGRITFWVSRLAVMLFISGMISTITYATSNI